MAKTPSIAVLTPCRVARDVLPETKATLAVFRDAGYSIKVRVRSSHLENSRSRMLSEFIETHDAVLFWDSDVVAKNALEVIDMVKRNAFAPWITGAVYPKKDTTEPACGPLGALNEEGLHPTSYVAGGCMLITREVAKKVGRFLPMCVSRDRRYRPFFHSLIAHSPTEPGLHNWLGEDVSFCLRAAQEMIPTMVDPNPVLGHYGSDETTIYWSNNGTDSTA